MPEEIDIDKFLGTPDELEYVGMLQFEEDEIVEEIEKNEN